MRRGLRTGGHRGDGRRFINLDKGYEAASTVRPHCGGRAGFLRGRITVDDGIIDIVSASPWTHQGMAGYEKAGDRKLFQKTTRARRR